jgi:hypothetical protein
LLDGALTALRSRRLLIGLVGLGVTLRVAQYLSDRSLWADEASLALNLIGRPLGSLTRPLEFNQAAPVGFLFVEGIVARVVGFSEDALRFFPLVAGVVSLPLFAWLARRLLSQAAAAVATLLFAVADGLIYYSSEVKPYGIDVAVAVALLAAALLIVEASPRRPRLPLVVGVAGLFLIPLSYPSIFIVVSVTAVLATRLLVRRRFSLRSPESMTVLIWAAAALAIGAFGATRARGVRDSLTGTGRFLGVNGSSSPLHALNAMGTRIVTALGEPWQGHALGRVLVVLTALCWLLGAAVLARKKPAELWMLLLPFPLLLVASAAHVYPILERTELFLLPAVVVLVAEGVVQAVRWSSTRWTAAPALVLAVAVLAGPVAVAAGRLVHPRTSEEIKPVLRYVRDHWRTGDTLYVAAGSQDAFLYYERCKCLSLTTRGGSKPLWPVKPLSGVSSQTAAPAASLSPSVVLGGYYGVAAAPYERELDRLRERPRIWFLYSHLPDDWTSAFVRATFLARLASHETQIAEVDRPGAHAYLFERRS